MSRRLYLFIYLLYYQFIILYNLFIKLYLYPCLINRKSLSISNDHSYLLTSNKFTAQKNFTSFNYENVKTHDFIIIYPLLRIQTGVAKKIANLKTDRLSNDTMCEKFLHVYRNLFNATLILILNISHEPIQSHFSFGTFLAKKLNQYVNRDIIFLQLDINYIILVEWREIFTKKKWKFIVLILALLSFHISEDRVKLEKYFERNEKKKIRYPLFYISHCAQRPHD